MQTNACEDLRTVTLDINQRLGVIEQSGSSSRGSVPPLQAGEDVPSRDVERIIPVVDSPISASKEATNVEWDSDMAITPAWSRVVKEGRRLKHVAGNATLRPKSCLTLRGKKTNGIVGTSTGGNIKVIKTKRVSVFATRFSPDLDSGTLADYLKNKLGRDVTCQKLDTAQSRFSSFKIIAECKDVGEMYEPELWPEGIFVRRFYEARKTRATTGPVELKIPASMSGAGPSAAI